MTAINYSIVTLLNTRFVTSLSFEGFTIFANQGLRSSTHTFSSRLVYLTEKSKARAKRFDWMQLEYRCVNRDARTWKTFISKWQFLSRWKH